MYSSLGLLALFASAVVATIPGLPDCSQGCISGDFGGCGNLDVKCICTNEPLLRTLSCCVSQRCDTLGQAGT